MSRKSKNGPERFFLGCDQSSHWYLIPDSKSKAWSAFLALDEDDPRSWAVPEWAKTLGGGPESITFTDPI